MCLGYPESLTFLSLPINDIVGRMRTPIGESNRASSFAPCLLFLYFLT